MTLAGILYIVLGLVSFGLVVFFAYAVSKRGMPNRPGGPRHKGAPPPTAS